MKSRTKEKNEFEEIINQISKQYKINLWFILLTSFTFLISLFLPLLMPTPTYLALGAVEIRFSQLIHIGGINALITILIYTVSLFVFSVALANINLIAKSQRTLTEIPKEIMRSITTYAWRIWFIYTIVMLIAYVIVVVAYGTPWLPLAYLIGFILFFITFFVPPAIVIEQCDIPDALSISIHYSLKFWKWIFAWVITGCLILVLFEAVLFFVLPSTWMKFVIPIVNALIILPLMTLAQTEIYLKRYPLSPP